MSKHSRSLMMRTRFKNQQNHPSVLLIFEPVSTAPQLLPCQDTTRGDSSRSSNNTRANNPTHASTSYPRGEGSRAAPPPPPTLLRLAPRPGFKIRVSRSRPAPKVSILLSTVSASNNQPLAACSPNRGGGGGAGSVTSESPRQGQRRGQPEVEAKGGGCRTVVVSFEGGKGRARDEATEEGTGGRGGKGEGGGQEGGGVVVVEGGGDHGVWHQVVSPRLVGLKGCDGLAS